MRDWVTNIETTYYLIGSVVGPHPYPMMVRDFQSVIGNELKKQHLRSEGRLPDALVACVGGGSNAIGTFYPFEDDPGVKMYGVEAGGKGLRNQQARRFSLRRHRRRVPRNVKQRSTRQKRSNIEHP